jgi:hypothetical protein
LARAEQRESDRHADPVNPEIRPLRAIMADYSLPDLNARSKAQNTERSCPFLYPAHAQQERKQSRHSKRNNVKDRM